MSGNNIPSSFKTTGALAGPSRAPP
ncbi:hypothetical protein YPPY101_3277, partial [Yersinia pestis PY-101]